ncbi:hypothetical protein K1T71_011541 [Dendrolimus kikuchii]|uniref:Uncharacterized protein n=1 Tax=Dendrolimus kikuchii TaxID=765133 RepID=A0ACC1CPC3_9NEOP|nr:hypothetical protein K1T71_011541 [Dendrolimus kikuchii]
MSLLTRVLVVLALLALAECTFIPMFVGLTKMLTNGLDQLNPNHQATGGSVSGGTSNPGSSNGVYVSGGLLAPLSGLALDI